MKLTDIPFCFQISQEYKELRNNAYTREDAIALLLDTYGNEVEDPDDAPLFWVGLAASQCDWKEVSKAHLEKMLTMLEVVTSSDFGLNKRSASALKKKLLDPEYAKEPVNHKKISDERFLNLQEGDVYMLPLRSDAAKEAYLDDTFLLLRIHKKWAKIDHVIYPYAYLMIWLDQEPPKSDEDLNRAGYLRTNKPLALGEYLSWYAPLRIKPTSSIVNEHTLEHRICLIKSNMTLDECKLSLDKFEYIGNFKDARLPDIVEAKSGKLNAPLKSLAALESFVCTAFHENGIDYFG